MHFVSLLTILTKIFPFPLNLQFTFPTFPFNASSFPHMWFLKLQQFNFSSFSLSSWFLFLSLVNSVVPHPPMFHLLFCILLPSPPFLALDSHPPPAASLSLPRWSPPQLSVGPLLAPSTARAGPSSQSSPSSLMPAGGGAYKFRCVTAFLTSMWHPVTPFVAACDALWRDPPAFSGHRWLLVDPSSSSSAVGGLQSRSWRSKEPPVMRFTEGGGRGVEG